MSLTNRILIVFLLVSVLGWQLILEPVIKRVERQYLEAAEEPMVDTAEILAAIVSQYMEKDGKLPDHLHAAFDQVHDREFEARIYSLLKTRVDMELTITDAEGIIIFDSEDPSRVGIDHSPFFNISRTLQGRYGARSTQTDENDDSTSVMHVGAPILVKGEIAGVVSVSKPQASMFTFIEQTRNTLRAFALLGVAVFLSIGILLSRWVTHPLRVLTRHAENVAEGSRQPIPKMPGRHLSKLGDSIEEMRDALEDRNYVESYVRTLTHEMKGPVAAVRGAAEILDGDPAEEQRRNFARNILAESERLQRLIDRLLALAALENRKRLDSPKPVNLSELTSTIIDEIRDHSPDPIPTLEFSADTDAWVYGEEFLLETAVRNLLTNAIEFSPEDGRIVISIHKHKGRVKLTVQDNGPGLPDYAEDKVFDHFYSLPRPSSGHKSSGLGLCFVRECAQLHRGEANLVNHSDGGALATLELPAAPEG